MPHEQTALAGSRGVLVEDGCRLLQVSEQDFFEVALEALKASAEIKQTTEFESEWQRQPDQDL